jgi:hypothetical protein
MLEDKEDGLGARSRLHNAQNMYHCMHYLVVMSSVLLVYLFPENESYGSKKPFAFILWCTRKSCRAQEFANKPVKEC